MFDNLIDKKLNVEILSYDLETVCKAYMLIGKDYTVIELKDNNKIFDCKETLARMKNGSLVILLNGVINSMHSNSYDPHESYRFYETLYMTNYFEDKYSKVTCQIPLISNWFNQKYYETKSEESTTSFIIENEKEFVIKFESFEISLYYEARFTLGQLVQIQPLTYLVIKSQDLKERNELHDILNDAKHFYQIFFFDRFKSFNLTFIHENYDVISHSVKYPYKKDIPLQDEYITWFSFREVELKLEALFHSWMISKSENLTIEELFLDSITNTSSINRFLSSMRILEMLSKRISDQAVVDEAKCWKVCTNEQQANIKGEKKKFVPSWLLQPFIKYKQTFTWITEANIVQMINNRNYYTHRNYKVEGLLDPAFLQKLTNTVLGISKALFFLQMGMDEERVKRVAHSFNSDFFYFEPIDNKSSTFYRKEEL